MPKPSASSSTNAARKRRLASATAWLSWASYPRSFGIANLLPQPQPFPKLHLPSLSSGGNFTMTEIENRVRSFIRDNFMFREDRAELSDSESLIDAGLIDSTGVLEL